MDGGGARLAVIGEYIDHFDISSRPCRDSPGDACFFFSKRQAKAEVTLRCIPQATVRLRICWKPVPGV